MSLTWSVMIGQEYLLFGRMKENGKYNLSLQFIEKTSIIILASNKYNVCNKESSIK